MERRVPLISLICPCHNEKRNISVLRQKLQEILTPMSQYRFEIIFVDDGSTDHTALEILAQPTDFFAIKLIELSRNFGKEAALTAGLEHAQGDAVIPIDADLQDPPELIPAMLSAWDGNDVEIILAQRTNRESDSRLKRWSASIFYRTHNTISPQKIPSNTGDFRLLDRVVVNAIIALPERQRFMKGIFSWVGFRTHTIQFTRPARESGASKFSFWQLWNLALESITSFTTLPLRLWTYIGALISLSSFGYAAYVSIRVIANGVEVPGYASTIVLMLFLGGIQLIGIGILGEYMGRTYMETKMRPIYIIRRVVDLNAVPQERTRLSGEDR
jgi:glycosyltransferase involved in cell wall biosynthesis